MSEQPHPIIQLIRKDRRYRFEAYQFLREALTYAQDVLGMGGEGPEEEIGPDEGPEGEMRERHLTGQQLCEAVRQYAQMQFGLMAKVVLNHWGIHSTSDFGEIVYNLIDVGMLKKSETDRREDFDNAYDFDEVFSRKAFRMSAPSNDDEIE